MFVQAIISCECGCISRFEFQSGKDTYICPNCKKVMNENTFKNMKAIMGEFSDLNSDILKHASGLHEPEMRVASISISDLED